MPFRHRQRIGDPAGATLMQTFAGILRPVRVRRGAPLRQKSRGLARARSLGGRSFAITTPDRPGIGRRQRWPTIDGEIVHASGLASQGRDHQTSHLVERRRPRDLASDARERTPAPWACWHRGEQLQGERGSVASHLVSSGGRVDCRRPTGSGIRGRRHSIWN